MTMAHDDVDAARAVLADAGAWLASRRWFGDKSRHIVRVRSVAGAPFALPTGRLLLATMNLTFADGGEATYFVPVVVTPYSDDSSAIGSSSVGGVRWTVHEALASPVVQRWMIEMAAASARLEDGERTWRWRTVGDGTRRLTAAIPETPSSLSAEQSNTSLRFGDHVVAKVFRKLQPGINPDVEIGSFLRERASFDHVPALLGEALMLNGFTCSVAAFFAFVPNHGDGWTWLLSQLSAGQANARRVTLPALSLLGERTAQLHLALASDRAIEAFRPEPYDQAMLASEIERLHQELDETIHLLEPDYGRTIDLSALSSRLVAITEDLTHLRGTVRIRVHGDYHLGQVLRTITDDFSVLDFEGEPSRPIAARRTKAAALRDVAGMLRSLDYAGAMFEREADQAAGGAVWVRRWLGEARTAFLAGYRRRIAASSASIVPRENVGFQRALGALELEKALYEVRYEMNNRPDWVQIPLTALLSKT